MCINRRTIKIKRNGHYEKMVVDCGHCPSCLQKKADLRTMRINNSNKDGYMWIFCTLTYQNKFVPYIKRSDLYEHYKILRASLKDDEQYKYMARRYKDDILLFDYEWKRLKKEDERDLTSYIPVYRDYNIRKNPKTHAFEDTKIDAPIDYVPVSWYGLSNTTIKDLKSLRGYSYDKIGVCMYSDFQNFLKRLRQYLHRNYGNQSPSFLYYGCTEYGETYARPHIHALLRVPTGYYKIFKCAINESWQFDNTLDRKCEIARNAAAYVSSYVNCSTYLPPLLAKDFKCKHSYSPSLGFDNPAFTYDSLAQKIYTGNLTYTTMQKFDGIQKPVTLPIPKYVISRYFPKFKGFSNLSPDEVFCLVQKPQYALVDTFAKKLGMLYTPNEFRDDMEYYKRFTDYHLQEPQALCTKLRNLKHRLFQGTLLYNEYSIDESPFESEYAYLYSRVWQLYYSQCLKSSYERLTDVIQNFEMFDNIVDYYCGDVSNDSLDNLMPKKCDNFVTDINKFPILLKEHNRLYNKFIMKDKSRKLNNYVMSQKYYV